MFNTQFPEEVQKLVTKLSDLRLTGSRRFGPITVESDWDFYVAANPETISTLQRLGFETMHHIFTYKDMAPIVLDVYENYARTIHVIVVLSDYITIMDKVHNLIDKLPVFRTLDKQQRKLLVKQLIRAMFL